MADSPCEWVVDPSEVCEDWDTLTPAVQEAALSLASSFLWAATGRRFGVCPITVHPCQDSDTIQQYRVYPVRYGEGRIVATLDNGVWRNCGCGPSCCCRARCRIALRGPVASVDEVIVDGSVVESYSYRVDAQEGTYWLVRLDGQCWPTCVDVEDPDAFVVTYERGEAIPRDLEIATGLLACEWSNHLINRKCKLPSRLTTLTRDGVTVQAEPAPVDGMFTGLNEVDRVIRTHNPTGRSRGPVLISPDLEEDLDFITVVEPGL